MWDSEEKSEMQALHPHWECRMRNRGVGEHLAQLGKCVRVQTDGSSH